jgi:ferredoxin
MELENPYTYVVTEPCVGCKDTSCVEVCPVDCFKEDEEMLVIDPEECINCAACVPVCPENAIYLADEVPEQWKQYVRINLEKSKVLPGIYEKKPPLNSASE